MANINIQDQLRRSLDKLKRDPKQLVVVMSVAVVVGLLFYLIVILRPQLTAIADIRSKLGKARNELKSATNDIAMIPSMTSTVETYNKKIGTYDKTLPTEDGIPDFLASLSSMAKNCNMAILAIVPVESKTDTNPKKIYKEIPIKITARAGYHDLGKFLASLESSDRFIKISDIRVKYNSSTPLKHDIELLLATYVLLGGK